MGILSNILVFLLPQIIMGQGQHLVTVSTPIRINLQTCNMESNSEWTRISIGADGGSRPYEYFFDEYPEGWKYTQANVYIPKENLFHNRKFPCRLRIVDSFGNQARATIVILISEGTVSLSSTLYPYQKDFEDDFFNVGLFRDRPRLIRSGTFYTQNQNIDLRSNQNYVSQQQLARYQRNIQQLNSNNFASSKGAGLFDFYSTFNQKGSYSLQNLFTPSFSRSSDLYLQSLLGKSIMRPSSLTSMFPSSSTNVITTLSAPSRSLTIGPGSTLNNMNTISGMNLGTSVSLNLNSLNSGLNSGFSGMNTMNTMNSMNTINSLGNLNSISFNSLNNAPTKTGSFGSVSAVNSIGNTVPINSFGSISLSNTMGNTQNSGNIQNIQNMANVNNPYGSVGTISTISPQNNNLNNLNFINTAGNTATGTGTVTAVNGIGNIGFPTANRIPIINDNNFVISKVPNLNNLVSVNSGDFVTSNNNVNAVIRHIGVQNGNQIIGTISGSNGNFIITDPTRIPAQTFPNTGNGLNNQPAWLLYPSTQVSANGLPMYWDLLSPGQIVQNRVPSPLRILPTGQIVNGLPSSWEIYPSVSGQIQQPITPSVLQLVQGVPNGQSIWQLVPPSNSPNIITPPNNNPMYWQIAPSQYGPNGLPISWQLVPRTNNIIVQPSSPFYPFYPFPNFPIYPTGPTIIPPFPGNMPIDPRFYVLNNGTNTTRNTTNTTRIPTGTNTTNNNTRNNTVSIVNTTNTSTTNTTTSNTTTNTTRPNANTTNATNATNTNQTVNNGSVPGNNSGPSNQSASGNNSGNGQTRPSLIPNPPLFNITDYSNLPNQAQIDDLIVNSDTNALNRIIDNVFSIGNLTCQQKSAYLSNFMARVQSAISMKQYAANELQQVVNAATKMYNNILVQINTTKQQEIALNTQTLKDKLKIDLTTIDGLFAEFNDIDTSTGPLESEIQSLKKQISALNTRSDIDRQELVRQKLSFNQADVSVKNLQSQLAQAKSKKTQIQNNITKIQTIINQSQTKYKANQEIIINLQEQILQLGLIVDTQKFNYGNLQAQVQKYRQQIARATKKQSQLTPQLINLQQRLRIEKKKSATDEFEKLKQMIAGLQRTLPTLNKFVDDNYYRCNKALNLTSSQNGASIVYIVGAPDFQNYIQSSYFMTPDWSKMAMPAESIRLTSINILDPTWQSAFGAPYSPSSFIGTNDFSFKEDFNCLNPSSLQSGFGDVASVGNRFIMIQDPNGMTKLNLGTCSRLESTLYLPTIGQKIYWRGVALGRPNQYNIYRATCI